MPANNSVSFKNNMNIPTPPKIRPLAESNKQAEKAQVGLTEKQFQQNIAELKSILTQVDALMNNSNNSPETVARCQALMGYAAAINLPQSRKNQLIGQFPPRVQQMYKQVAKSSEAKSAQRGVMQQAQETAMAQKHNDIFVQNFNQQFMAGNFSALQGQPPAVWNACLFNSSINTANALNIAIQNGWDINAKHKNPDGTESTYVEYQGAQIDKGIEGANRANTTIKDLIGKSPRTKEEEEEYRKAQQVAENHHKNLMGNAQNVVNAIKSGKLNPEEMEKAQAEMRKIEEYEKEQRILAQYYRDLAAKETDPHRRAELLAQAGVHESRANEAHQVLNNESVKQTNQNQSQIKNTEHTDSHRESQNNFNKETTPSIGNIAKNNQEITPEQLNEVHQAVKTNAQYSTVNLSNQVDVDKPIVAGTENQNPHLGKNPVDMQTNKNTNSAIANTHLNGEAPLKKYEREHRWVQEYRDMAQEETDPHKRDKYLMEANILENNIKAQEYRDLATNETNPQRRAELLTHASVHESRANEARQVLNSESVKQTNQNQSRTSDIEQIDSNRMAQSDLNREQTIFDNSRAEVHQTKQTAIPVSTRNLNDIANLSNPVTRNLNPNTRISPNISVSHSDRLAALNGFHRNINIDNQSRETQNTSGIQPLDMDTPITAPQAQNTQPRKTISLAQSTATSNNQQLDMDTPITAPQSQNTQPRKMPSIAQNTSNNQPLDMDTPITAPQSQNIQAPKIPSIAQNIAAIRPLNTNTPTQTQNTAKTSSGLSNTIRSIASIVPNSNTNNTENNVKPLDTSRVA